MYVGYYMKGRTLYRAEAARRAELYDVLDYNQHGEEMYANVPYGVEEIGEDAFRALAVRGAAIPDTVRIIGESAFSGCRKISGLTLPKGLEVIGDYAFKGCGGIGSMILPDGVKEIGKGAFLGSCPREILIPGSVRKIGDEAIGYLLKEKQEMVPTSGYQHIRITEYAEKSAGTVIHGIKGSEAERYAKANGFDFRELTDFFIVDGTLLHYFGDGKSVVIPDGVTRIGDGVFAGCAETEAVEIPVCVKHIGKRAFAGCKKLEKLGLHEGLETIGEDCFLDCFRLNSAAVPCSVREIGANAFGFESEKIQYVPLGSGYNYVKGRFMRDKYRLSGKKDSAAERYAKETGIAFTENQ